jgi:hypothetical protein
MIGVIGEIVGLVRDIVDRIPTPDPELRRARLLARLTRRKVRLEARLAKNPNNLEAKIALAGVLVELEQVAMMDDSEVPTEGGGDGAE